MENISSFIISNIIFKFIVDVLEMPNDDGFSVDSGVNVLVCLLNISSTFIITDGFVFKFSCTIVSWDLSIQPYKIS